MSPLSTESLPIEQILDGVAHFIQTYWNLESRPEQLFYNPERLQRWIKKAEKIGAKEGLDEYDRQLVLVALHFITYGYLKRDLELGEQAARQYLLERQFPEADIQIIEALIAGVRVGKTPELLREKVLHDTLYAYLGTKGFREKITLLRMEEEMIAGRPYQDDEWTQYVLNLGMNNRYYTAYAENKYGARRRKNIANLRQSQMKANVNAQKERTGKNIGRGIDTLYRVNFSNHINLSSIADGKANILISINTILLSIIITIGSTGRSFLESTLEADAIHYTPMLVLLCTCVASLVFAVLSTRPKIVEKAVDQKPQTNLLFFGNFLQVSQNEFVEYLEGLKNNQKMLYGDMGKDLYNLGHILKQKYRLLTVAYNVFLFGIILTALVFLLIQFS